MNKLNYDSSFRQKLIMLAESVPVLSPISKLKEFTSGRYVIVKYKPVVGKPELRRMYYDPFENKLEIYKIDSYDLRYHHHCLLSFITEEDLINLLVDA